VLNAETQPQMQCVGAKNLNIKQSAILKNQKKLVNVNIIANVNVNIIENCTLMYEKRKLLKCCFQLLRMTLESIKFKGMQIIRLTKSYYITPINL
jgi:hypothetical protein